MSEGSVSEGSAPLQIEFDLRVYALEVLQKAALKFTNLASFDFRVRENHMADVVVRPILAIELNETQFAGSYRTEVLDQHLRSIVARETESERNLILAYAFSNTKLVSP